MTQVTLCRDTHTQGQAWPILLMQFPTIQDSRKWSSVVVPLLKQNLSDIIGIFSKGAAVGVSLFVFEGDLSEPSIKAKGEFLSLHKAQIFAKSLGLPVPTNKVIEIKIDKDDTGGFSRVLDVDENIWNGATLVEEAQPHAAHEATVGDEPCSVAVFSGDCVHTE